MGTELKKQNYDMLIAIADCRNTDLGNFCVRSVRSDCLIIFGRVTDNSALQSIAGEGIPIVSWGVPTDNTNYHSVGIDNAALVRDAVKRLILAGRQRIGFIGSEQACAEVSLRYQGYCEAVGTSRQDC